MKTMLIVCLSVLFVSASAFMIAACTPQAATATEIVPPTATAVLATNTPLPTETDTPVPTATTAPTMTATAVPTEELRVRYIGNNHVYQKSSTVTLSMSVTEGNFYGVATSSVSEVKFACKFESIELNYLVCSGGNVPLDTTIDFKLYRAETDESVFEQTFVFPREKTIPSGVSCEVEPQWNSTGEPQHELGTGCFAASCWKDGQFFWGSNDTCVKPWPFEWDFPHPLAALMPTVN